MGAGSGGSLSVGDTPSALAMRTEEQVVQHSERQSLRGGERGLMKEPVKSEDVFLGLIGSCIGGVQSEATVGKG